jgi:hypothetical protein
MERAVVYMGPNGLRCSFLSQYTVPYDDDKWMVRENYLRKVGDQEVSDTPGDVTRRVPDFRSERGPGYRSQPRTGRK